MKFDPNLSLNIRIVKRKRKRMHRFILLISLILLALAINYYKEEIEGFITNNISWIKNEKDAVSMQEDNVEDSQNTNNNEEDSQGDRNSANGTINSGNNSDDSGNSSNIPQDSTQMKDYDAFKNDLEEYIKGFTGQYGVYFVDLNTGQTFGINETDEYIAASTVKIPLNLYLFKQIEDGTVKPDTEMIYTQEDYEGGTGRIQYEKVGNSYTIRTLSKYSIEVSDNVATNMLLRLLERKNLKDYMRSLGGEVVDDQKNISCPKDMALYMQKVYEFYKSNPEMGEELIGYLENTIFNERIPKYLPKDIKVAHKIGNQVRAVHDVGIVFDKNPYVISVMSKDVNETESYEVIANISKKIYDYINGTY